MIATKVLTHVCPKVTGDPDVPGVPQRGFTLIKVQSAPSMVVQVYGQAPERWVHDE